MVVMVCILHCGGGLNVAWWCIFYMVMVVCLLHGVWWCVVYTLLVCMSRGVNSTDNVELAILFT